MKTLERCTWIVLLVIGFVGGAAIFNYADGQIDPAYEGTWGAGFQTQGVVYVGNPKIGDVNRDGSVNLTDLTIMNNLIRDIYLYDVDGNNKLDQSDLNYMVDYILHAGPCPKMQTRCRDILVRRNCMP